MSSYIRKILVDFFENLILDMQMYTGYIKMSRWVLKEFNRLSIIVFRRKFLLL